MWKTVERYFQKHVHYNSVVHVIGGVGIGIMMARPLFGAHPVRWGVILLLISLLGHLYPLYQKK